MQLKTTAPSDDQTLSEVFSQMLTNDTVNQTVDDTAILDTGIGRGNVVKYSSASGKWVLCNGTVKLNSTDTVGIVEYANGTSGQVRTSGVYLDATLTSTLPYYCQADGTLGITVTKVFMGCIASSGRFMMVSGSGSSVQPATTTELGGVIVGTGLNVDVDGVLTSGKTFELFTSSGTFTVPTGVTTVYVTGCGGGGGGYGGTSPTVTAGGTTSFGALLSLIGGGAGSAVSGGVSGGWGGQSSYVGYITTSGAAIFCGGDTLFGIGGRSIISSNLSPTGYGAGGYPMDNNDRCRGGGGAQCAHKQKVTVTPGATIAITIGAAGTNNKNSACNGTSGFMLIEW